MLLTLESKKGNVDIVLQTLESQQGKCRHCVINRRKAKRTACGVNTKSHILNEETDIYEMIP